MRIKSVDVVLLDMRMPGMSGLEVLQRLREGGTFPPVIMLTAFGNVGSAVEAMKTGAFDYLSKPADNDELLAVVQKAAEHASLRRENRELKKQIGRMRETRIIDDSPDMRAVVELIEQVRPSKANVLILGESGTGKELVGLRLSAGMVLAIEPMVAMGSYDVVTLKDGWTVVTCDGKLSAHYENTVVITDGEPELLTLIR